MCVSLRYAYAVSTNGNNLYDPGVTPLDLIGVFEAHLILGVERSRLARWLKEDEAIVPPNARPKSGPVWARSTIWTKLREMYADASSPLGEGDEATIRWARSRSATRLKRLEGQLLQARRAEGMSAKDAKKAVADEIERIFALPVAV